MISEEIYKVIKILYEWLCKPRDVFFTIINLFLRIWQLFQHSASSQQETASGNLDAREAPQPVPERGIAGAVEREEVPTLNGSSATEIQQESIKNTLKEIISEIEEAVVSEVNSDNTVATNKITQEASRVLLCLANQKTSAHNLSRNSSFENLSDISIPLLSF